MYGSYVNEMDSSSLDSLDETGMIIYIKVIDITFTHTPRERVRNSLSKGAENLLPMLLC